MTGKAPDGLISAHFGDARIADRSEGELRRRLAWLDRSLAGLPEAASPQYGDLMKAERKRVETRLRNIDATSATIAKLNARAGIFDFDHLDHLDEPALRERLAKLRSRPPEDYFNSARGSRARDQAEIKRIEDHLDAISGNYPRPVAAKPPDSTAFDITESPDLGATRPWRETHYDSGNFAYSEGQIDERSAQQCLDRLAWRLTRRPLRGKRGDGARAEIRRLAARLTEIAIGETERKST